MIDAGTISADTSLTIAGGTMDVAKAYVGLESATVTIAGGKTSMVTSDDGINVAGGNDGSGQGAGPGGGLDAFAATSASC